MSPRLIVDRQGAILRLTLSNPQARNALHPDMYDAGMQAIAEASRDRGIRVVVLTGEGETFCAGGNVNRLRENRSKPKDFQRQSIDRLHAWIRAIRACPKPVVTAVEGAAAGAGFSLALASDMVVAAEDARFVMAYVKIGVSPDGGATLALAERVPHPLAFEWIATGKPVGAPRLAELGLVNRVVPRGEALATAMAIAGELAAAPSRVLGRIKQLLSRAEAERLSAHLDAEREAFADSLHEPDAGEGLDAFLERRSPRFNQEGEES
jgi:enoyl-CoA hydratase/carnithine racemase